MKIKFAVVGFALLLLGIVTFMYAESTGDGNPFIAHGEKKWSRWHFFAIGAISLSASSFLVFYWLERASDRDN